MARIWNKHKQTNAPLKKKVFVAMSGGVDSSVAALLLKKQGYDIIGIFMRCYNVDGCAEHDAEDARRVAEHLDVPFYIWDFEEEYKKKVVEYMVEEYRKGLTPNPDVMCNREIKFGLFLKKALEMGANYVATGHYVRVAYSKERMACSSKNHKPLAISHKLFAAKDANKDQSYFLWTLTQEQLQHCLFPIGDYLKPQVRAIARKAGLSTADKKDSQGICFLGQVTIEDFLKEYIPEKRGDVLLAPSGAERTTAGIKIGEHRGAQFYTIGQRHIGVANGKWRMANGRNQSTRQWRDPQRLYVASKDMKTNTLIVAEGDDSPALYRKEILLRDVNFVNSNYKLEARSYKLSVMARVRYRQPLSPAALTFSNLRESANSAKKKISRISVAASKQSLHPSAMLIFEHPQKFVAPGQSAVFYVPAEARRAKEGVPRDPWTRSGRSSSELRMLGGGVIV